MTEKEKSANDLKEALASAKGNLRKFNRENKIKDPESIKDPKVKKQFEALALAQEEAQSALDAVREAKKAEKGNGVGARQYSYGKVIDLETKEERELTKLEEKRWRAHARKAGKKLDPPVEGAAVEFDPNFFAPKVKKEKPAKEEKPAEEGEKAAEKATEKPAKSKKVRSKSEDDDED